MLPTPNNYSVWPSVVPADKNVDITITATEKVHLFPEGAEYELTVISADADEVSYKTPRSHKKINVVAKGGALCFGFTFSEEQEHIISISRGGNKLGEVVLYSLYEDLYRLLPVRGDFHGHSFRSDGKRDPSAVAGYYREMGYDFFTLTDHNRYYPGGEIDETFSGVKLGITRVFGEEVHAPGSVVHIVHAGGKSSVAELYVHHVDEFEAEIAEKYMAKVPEHIPENFKERYAKAIWTSEKIREAGGIAIFPHPFWRPGASRVHNVRYEYSKEFITSGLFDAYELIGGMTQSGNNESVAMWADLRAEGNKINVVGSSDVHAFKGGVYFPNYFTICFAEANENDSIIEAVKRGMSVAVEGTGTEYERQYRAYGSYRLVTYAQYLFKYYFPELQRICQGEGVAMRAYACGDITDPKVIELQVEATESYKARFFGRSPAILPTAEILAFEDKWRARHLEGPLTKGSALGLTDTNARQI